METLPVLYCIDIQKSYSGNLYKNQLDKSIKQLMLMASKAQVQLDVYVAARSKNLCPDSCIWVDANQVDEICKKNFKLRGDTKRYAFATFWRLLMLYMPPFNSMEKLLYLDTDTWCIDPKFFKIFSIEFENSSDCLAVKDIVLESNNYINKLLEAFYSLIPPKRRSCFSYVNAGVLLLNVKNILSHFQTTEQLLSKTSSIYGIWSQLHFVDQDIINILFDVQEIPLSFNTLANPKSAEYDCDKYMLHFTGNVWRYEQYNNKFPDFRIDRFKSYLKY